MSAEHGLMPFLLAAMDWRGMGEWTPERVLATPDVAHYVEGWMRPGDGGTVALVDGRAVGAAWWRTFGPEEPGYGYVAPEVPEIGMGVLAPWRGAGIGAALLDGLVVAARETAFTAVSLSVEDGNERARGMYVRRGFTVVGRTGGSDTMLLTL